jgi:zinc protease
VKSLLSLSLLACLPRMAHAAGVSETTGSAGGQTWTLETLQNGLRVIYAPMPTSPTTHVRVLYHVGSRDERPDRQGFAHMFEHMMFRGSAHVKPEEHMKLIGLVGGYSNAYTSFDQTVYVQTLPATYTELALWLEADRMASFKVSPEIFIKERDVVNEEYRMRANQPYGTMWDELAPVVFKKHPYQWTPIGKMEQLRQAEAPELQAFFNKYYAPNNAILVIAGNIDVEKTKAQVQKYFGWIPGAGTSAGGTPVAVPRNIPEEPAQTEPRRLEVKMPVPLPRVITVFHMPPAASDDVEPLGLLMSILGDGRSSRLSRALVTSADPMAVGADAMMLSLQDGGAMGAMATVMSDKHPAEVEKVMRQQLAALRETPVTAEELEKVKQQNRVQLAERFETAEKVASELGDEMLTRNNLNRIPTARQRLEAYTPDDLLRVARKYIDLNTTTTMIITPGQAPALPPGPPPRPTPPTTAAANAEAAAAPAPNAPAVQFPPGYPTEPPMSGKVPDATFEKGTSTTVSLPGAAAPVQVIVMSDNRTPTVNFSLTMRAGGHAEPAGKEGVAGLTASMVRRGPKGKTFDQFNEELESRAISVEVSDGGDFTRVSGFCLKEQLPFALNAAKSILLTPAFDPAEFEKLKNQSLNALKLSLDNPQTLASRQLNKALWGDSPLGKLTTVESLSSITLDDVKGYFNTIYRADNAILMISGDIAVPDGLASAATFLQGLPAGNLPKVNYDLPAAPTGRRVFVVDRPASKQSAIQMGVRAYSIQSDEKFAGSLTSQMLSSGIDSRLGRYVRAEKGYVYGVRGIFAPGRQVGSFYGQTDTKFPTTADTIEAMFKVFDDMKAAPVPEKELADSKFRVAGQLLMSMETIADQASRRVEGILNSYPIDYYDKYAQRIAQVSAEQVRDVVNKYVKEDQMTIVVVGPADTVKEQLGRLGPVVVVPPR